MNFIIQTIERTKKLGRGLFNNEDKYYTNNPNREYLFIGGSKDGRYITILDNEWRVLIPKFISRDNEVYNKIILSTPKTRLAVFVHENFSETDLLDVLLENYKK